MLVMLMQCGFKWKFQSPKPWTRTGEGGGCGPSGHHPADALHILVPRTGLLLRLHPLLSPPPPMLSPFTLPPVGTLPLLPMPLVPPPSLPLPPISLAPRSSESSALSAVLLLAVELACSLLSIATPVLMGLSHCLLPDALALL